MLVVVGLGVWSLADGRLTLGGLLAFLTLLMQCFGPVRTLADLVLGRETDLVALPWVGHRSPRWEPEPMRFAASRAIVSVLGSADRYEDRTNRPARRTAIVAPFMPPH